MSLEPRCRHGNIRSAEPCRDCDERDSLRARIDELSLAYAVQGLALEEMTAERDEARARVTELEADNERLRQDRLDYSCATTTEGMNASEWIWRTGKAERRAAELEHFTQQVYDEAQEQCLVAQAGLLLHPLQS